MDPAGPEVLGIDFGTSNTVAVLASPGRPPRVLSVDGSAWVPSAIYVDDDGTLSVGRDAERKARLAPERFEANPKRRVDDGEILLGVRVVPVVDAIAAVLRRVGEEARRQLNGCAPDEVHLTHPAQWGASRQNILLAAARSAGLGTDRIMLIPEPVAAAAHFASLPGKGLPPGSSLAVYDLGGGTFDCAVVGATAQGYTVLAESGLADVGGVDFDQAIVDHLGRTVSTEDPARWQALSRPRTAADRRAARSLREDVKAAKETLSRYAQTDLPLPDPFEDTLLTRREFEALIRPVTTRTVDVLAETVRRAGLSPDRLAGVYLVGGSSRIPLIASLISDRLGIVATTLDQPETSVAMGAALVPGGPRPSQQTAVVGGPPARQGPPSGPVAPMAGPPTGPPPGYGGPPVPPAGQGGAPAGSGNARRGLMVGLVVAAVLAIAAVVTVIVVSTKGSDAGTTTSTPATTSAAGSVDATTDNTVPSPSPDPTSATDTSPTVETTPTTPTTPTTVTSPTTRTTPTSTSVSVSQVDCPADPKDETTGMSPCLQTFSGSASDNGVCTADLEQYPELKTLIDNIKPAAFSACAFSKDGKVMVGILIQTTSGEARDALYDSERRGIGGTSETFEASGHTGSLATGAVVGTSAPEVVWKFDDAPIVIVLTASTADDTKTDVTVDELMEYRAAQLLPTGG